MTIAVIIDFIISFIITTFCLVGMFFLLIAFIALANTLDKYCDWF